MTWILKQTKVLGVLFIALVMLSAFLTYAAFTKKFADYDEVTLETSNIGLQLPMRADVKIRGVIVGEVLDYEPTAAGGVLSTAQVDLGWEKSDIGWPLTPEGFTKSIVRIHRKYGLPFFVTENGS
jgi:phospholipid/cholesterol/gamma-HCH transport system substrate-binding protein